MPEDAGIRFPGPSRCSSRLGFGTSGLAGELTRKESIALLETALEAGIRHFDTAPVYGAGESEKILGEFAARRRGEITLTTKFGLSPPRAQSLVLLGKEILRPLLRRVPGLKSGLAKSTTLLNRPANYAPESMQRSLTTSLRTLRTDHVDLLLMHEAGEKDLQDDIRRALDEEIKSGRIGMWGVGGCRDRIEHILAQDALRPPVLQFEWSPFAHKAASYSRCFCILYGSISLGLPQLRALLSRPRMQRDLSDRVGLDLADARVHPCLLVAASLVANPDGIVLFSTKKLERIREVAGAVRPDMLQAAGRFLNFSQAESAAELR